VGHPYSLASFDVLTNFESFLPSPKVSLKIYHNYASLVIISYWKIFKSFWQKNNLRKLNDDDPALDTLVSKRSEFMGLNPGGGGAD